MLYYSTIDGTQIGRASHYYRTMTSASAKVNEQNARAMKLSIKTRYKLAEIEEEQAGIDNKEIRE